MSSPVSLTVLRELGVLFETPCPPEPFPAAPLPATPLSEGPGLDHAFHPHTPLWNFEPPVYANPFAAPGARPVFETLPPDTPPSAVLERTKMAVVLGAADTPLVRRCLETPGVFLLLYEPDPVRLDAFARALSPARLANRAAILHGDTRLFMPPISQVLPPEVFQLGYPVFYALPGFEAWLAMAGLPPMGDFVRTIETLFYRHRMYHLSGQANSRSLPLRDMARGLFYDQQLHADQNLTHYATRPDIGPLKRAMSGETAVLVAAGPDLPERMDLLRGLRERAVVIAVNNALKPLLAGGVRPHFVVANDTSIATGRSWEGLPRLDDVILVGHSLTDLGGAVFPRSYLFGAFMPEAFGPKPSLRLHGSVITTAFSLARHLGCVRCVLAGVQLCSPDPWHLSYSRGSIHEAAPPPPLPLTDAFPQLAPVATPFGQTLYTSLNFLDAALWLLDEIRATGTPCVNLTRESLIHGPGVEYDPDPQVADTGLLAKRLARLAAMRDAPPRVAPALAVARRELALWTAVAGQAAQIEALAGAQFVTTAREALAHFDAGGISYLAQRYEDFDNAHMHALVFATADPARNDAGLRYYLKYVRGMALSLVAVLREQARVLEALAG